MAGGTHPLLHNINVYVAQDCTGKLHVCNQNENWEMAGVQMSSMVLQKMYEFSSVVLEKLVKDVGLKWQISQRFEPTTD